MKYRIQKLFENYLIRIRKNVAWCRFWVKNVIQKKQSKKLSNKFSAKKNMKKWFFEENKIGYKKEQQMFFMSNYLLYYVIFPKKSLQGFQKYITEDIY